MSYIELSTPVPDTKKILLSFWFRVPAVSTIAAKAAYDAWNNSDDPRPPMIGIIPLMVFGQPSIKYQTWTIKDDARVIGFYPPNTQFFWDCLPPFPACENCGYYTLPPSEFYQPTRPGGPNLGPIPVSTGNFIEIDPSYIGVDCTGDNPVLSININFPVGNLPTGAIQPIVSSLNGGPTATYDAGDGCGGRQGYTYRPDAPFQCVPADGNDWTQTAEVDDISFTKVFLGGEPENIKLIGPASEGFMGGQVVTPDHFHHLIFSLDVSNSISTTAGTALDINDGTTYPGTDTLTGDSPGNEGSRTFSAAKMFISFDDVNLQGKQLSAYYPTGYADKNAVLTTLAYNIAGSVSTSTVIRGPDCVGGFGTSTINVLTQTYKFSASAIPLGTIGLPATGIYVNTIYNVELGYLQGFLDTTLDTSVDANRRAFITKDGTPASVGASTKLIGKRPEILLVNTSNWKSGKNVGTLAQKPPISGVHVGKIDTYHPNASLHGDQGQ